MRPAIKRSSLVCAAGGFFALALLDGRSAILQLDGRLDVGSGLAAIASAVLFGLLPGAVVGALFGALLGAANPPRPRGPKEPAL